MTYSLQLKTQSPPSNNRKKYAYFDHRTFSCGFFSFACLSYAQEPVEKKSFNYSEWTKGLFAEAVTITGLAGAKAIYLGGIGAEEETGKPGEIRGADDIAGQCAYTFEKISRVLGKNEAKLKDIVKMTSYLTSSRLHWAVYRLP